MARSIFSATERTVCPCCPSLHFRAPPDRIYGKTSPTRYPSYNGDHVGGFSRDPSLGGREMRLATAPDTAGVISTTIAIVIHGTTTGRPAWLATCTTTVGRSPAGTARTAAISASRPEVAATTFRWATGLAAVAAARASAYFGK